MTDREKIVELRDQGLSHSEIGKRLGFSTGKVTYQLKLKPREVICVICGKKFITYYKYSSKTCGNKDCVSKQRSAGSTKNIDKKFEYTVDEPYSHIINSFIVEDLLLGKSIKEIALTYNRSPKHLEKHIKENLKHDVMEKYVRGFSEYQKEKVRRATYGKLREIREMGK